MVAAERYYRAHALRVTWRATLRLNTVLAYLFALVCRGNTVK